ncbi:MAG: carboxypeptidase-like regulatory domain-containing protein [Bacteroidetes bacterium]|nr:carboxypeptidase-like regulatory domain-containing protein [Bacteroidota bacterium]
MNTLSGYTRHLLLKTVCLLIITFISQLSPAQESISGKLVDALTREPLAGATIYIDQTKLTTQTDSSGMFRLHGVKLPARLIISYTGYAKLTVMLEQNKSGAVYELKPDGLALDNVVLRSATKDTWQKWGKLFADILFGKDMDKECVLQNPGDVWFQYDKKRMLLKARARKPLEVVNTMLGYKLHIDFDSLEYSLDKGNLLYAMTAYFEFIKNEDPAAARIFSANRLRAYRGSRMHFARSLYQGTLQPDGFLLYQYKGKSNTEKNRVERLLLQKLAEDNESVVMETANKVDLSGFGKDTAGYYKKVLNEPGYFFEDSLPVNIKERMRRRKEELTVFNAGTDSLLLAYKEPDQIHLPLTLLKKWSRMKEPESNAANYEFIQAGSGQEKFSLLYLLRGEAINLRANGIIENSTQLFWEGYLAGNRLAYDLPWDYDPLQDEHLLLNEAFSLLEGPGRNIENSLQHIANMQTGSALYLHIDKTVYDVGENVWFAAYLLRSSFPASRHHTLYVMLQDVEKKKKILEEKFILGDGSGAGYIFLPYTIPPGTYHLLAYTNTYPLEKNPVPFEQEIFIRPAITEFTMEYKDEWSTYRNDSLFINFIIKNEAALPIQAVSSEIQITADGKTILSGKERIRLNDKVILKGIPLEKIAGKKLVLHSTIQENGMAWNLRQELAASTNFVRIRWYPEGGDLVDGLPARLSYEIMDINYKPLSARMKLLKGHEEVAILNSDGSGSGTVEMVPGITEPYTVQLFTDSLRIAENDFPQVLRNGYNIAVQEGLITDSLRFSIRSTTPDTNVYVMVHDYKKHFHYEKLTLRRNEHRMILPAALLPEGLATITLFDEKGKPVAERSVFREPINRPVLQIELDSSTYHQRSKVKVTIKATDGSGNPVAAAISLACVLNSRIDSARFQDIVPYSFFNHYRVAATQTQKPDYSYYQKSNMEKYLRIQAWTRYKWQTLDSLKAAATPTYSLMQRGYVFYNDEKLKVPVEIALVTPGSLTTILTDSSGYFELDKEKLATEPDWKITLAVNEKGQKKYSIILVNDNDVLQDELALVTYPFSRKIYFVPEETASAGTVYKLLAPAIVKSRNGVDDDAARIVKGFKKDPSRCNDYVCMYNIINCINHFGGRPPVKGNYYLIRQYGVLQKYRYTGCIDGVNFENNTIADLDSVVFQLKGRYYNKEFYMADYLKYNPPVPETFTTLYWNPLIKTDENGEAIISFYTNDLRGRLMLIAEGITASSVLSGRRIFRVIQ